MKIKTLLIGLGNIGFRYDLHSPKEIFYTHAKALSAHEDFEFVAAIDVSLENRTEFEGKYGIKAYASLAELPMKDFDLVVVATPSGIRQQVLEDVTKNIKVKKVLVEKPLATTLQEAEGVLAWEKLHGAPVFVNYIRHPDPSTTHLKDMITKESHGKLLKVNLVYNRGLKNSASHFLEMLQSFLGEFDDFQLMAGQPLGDHDCSADFYLRFKNQVEVICSSVVYHDMNLGEMHFYFEGAIVRYLDQGRDIQVSLKKVDPKVPSRHEFVASEVNIENHLFKYQLNVLDQVRNSFFGKPYHLTSSQNALKLTALCERIENAVRGR